MVFLLCVICKKWRGQDAKCYNLKEEKKKTYVTSKVWYREFSRIRNIGIAIIEKWIAFRDRDALNSNPVHYNMFVQGYIYSIICLYKARGGYKPSQTWQLTA